MTLGLCCDWLSNRILAQLWEDNTEPDTRCDWLSNRILAQPTIDCIPSAKSELIRVKL